MKPPVDDRISILLNGKEYKLPRDCRLNSLAEELGLLARNGIAIAVNQSVIARSLWGDKLLRENDQVIIIQATQGG